MDFYVNADRFGNLQIMFNVHLMSSFYLQGDFITNFCMDLLFSQGCPIQFFLYALNFRKLISIYLFCFIYFFIINNNQFCRRCPEPDRAVDSTHSRHCKMRR